MLYDDGTLREYRSGDTVTQGITGMIGRHLFPYKYSGVPQFILDKASIEGTKVHTDLQANDMFGTVETDAQKWWSEIKKEHDIEIIDNEYIVTDGKHFSTPIDKVFKIKGALCLGDVKNTAVLDREYVSWQCSAGKHLFELVNPDLNVDKLFVIHIKSQTFEEVPIKPKDVIQDLFDAEIHGDQFNNPYLPSEDKNEKALALINKIHDIEVAIKEFNAEVKTYKEEVEKIFESTNMEKWENDLFVITKVEPYTREGFETKKFKESHPDLYKEYEKTINVKGSIRTKLKNK